MRITDLPFNKHIGVLESDDADLGTFVLPDASEYKNHVGTVHAGALYSLAEACSGQRLLDTLAERGCAHDVPVLRKAEIRYRRPVTGRIYGKPLVSDEELDAFHAELKARKRAMIKIAAVLTSSDSAREVTASFEWFVRRDEPG